MEDMAPLIRQRLGHPSAVRKVQLSPN
jgi:hypothetical protein